MSADRRIDAARTFLDQIRVHPPATRPRAVLVQENHELRQLLRQVLDVVADYEATEIDDEVTVGLSYGGLHLSPADCATVISALDEAAVCAEEEHSPSSPSDERATLYRELHERIGAMS
jgi:hypothetical protein